MKLFPHLVLGQCEGDKLECRSKNGTQPLQKTEKGKDNLRNGPARQHVSRSRITCRMISVKAPKSSQGPGHCLLILDKFLPLWMGQPGYLGLCKHVGAALPLLYCGPGFLFFILKVLRTSMPQVTNAESQEHQSINSFWGDFNIRLLPWLCRSLREGK